MDGSDGIEVVAEDIAKLAGGMISKMTGRQITLCVIVYFLLQFGSTATKEYFHDALESRRLDTDSHERVELSGQETARVRLLTQAQER